MKKTVNVFGILKVNTLSLQSKTKDTVFIMKIKKEKKTLQVFCDKDNPWRDIYKRPYFNEADGGRLIATDGIVMLIADQKLLRGKYESIFQKMPFSLDNFDKEVEVTFDAIEGAMRKFKLIPEKVSKDGGSPDCPECCGSGTVEYEYIDSEGLTHYHDEDCPICDGTGVREDCELVETGRMVLPKHAVFNLCGSMFKASRLMECVAAFREMGFGKMTLRRQNAQGENIFDVCEGMMFVMISRFKSAEDVVVKIETTSK